MASKRIVHIRSKDSADNRLIKEAEQLDLSDISFLSNPKGPPLSTFHKLDAERNRSLTQWALRSPSVDYIQENPSIVSEALNIRDRSTSKYKPSTLLSRGQAIIPEDISIPTPGGKHKLTPSEQRQVDFDIDLASRLSSLFLGAEEELTMAERPGTPEDDNKTILDSDEERILEESGGDLAPLATTEDGADEEIPIPIPPSTGGDNLALRQLYEKEEQPKVTTPLKTPISPISPLESSTRVGFKEGAIPKKPQQQIKIKYKPVPSIQPVTHRPPDTVVESGLKTDEINETLAIILSELKDLKTENQNLRALISSLTTKISGLEDQITNTANSCSIIAANTAKATNDISNLLAGIKQPLAGKPSVAPSPAPVEPEADPSLTDRDQMFIQNAREIYSKYLKPLKLTAITEELYITVQRMGGFSTYFSKMFPTNTEVKHHIEQIDNSKGKTINYLAVDRILERLLSRQHKEQYLPTDPSLGMYTGLIPATPSEYEHAETGSPLPGSAIEDIMKMKSKRKQIY